MQNFFKKLAQTSPIVLLGGLVFGLNNITQAARIPHTGPSPLAGTVTAEVSSLAAEPG